MTVHLFWPLSKVDHEAREVEGYASTEATDSQGEIVTLEALAAALPEYMKWANIREMHQASAVGVAQEAAVDGKGLMLRVKVIDDAAWRKVKAGVYKGFSIGGAVTARDAQRPHVITGVELTEISLVDRPANPEAVFAVWKSKDGKERTMKVLEDARPMADALKAARARLAQKWVATDGSAFERADDAARHELRFEKSTFAPASEPTTGLTDYALEGAAAHDDKPGLGDYADPGYQADGQRRYPLDSDEHIRAAWGFINRADHQRAYTMAQIADIKARIIAAWKAKIDRDGPPAARGKAAQTETLRKHDEAMRLMALLDELEWLEGIVPEDDAAAVAAVCAMLRTMVDAGDDALGKATRRDDLGAAIAKLNARNAALEQRLGADNALLRELKTLVEKVAAQPAVMPPSRLVAIDKGADVARELERIADQPPAVTAFELIKRAMREPLAFGAPLEK